MDTAGIKKTTDTVPVNPIVVPEHVLWLKTERQKRTSAERSASPSLPTRPSRGEREAKGGTLILLFRERPVQHLRSDATIVGKEFDEPERELWILRCRLYKERDTVSRRPFPKRSSSMINFRKCNTGSCAPVKRVGPRPLRGTRRVDRRVCWLQGFSIPSISQRRLLCHFVRLHRLGL